LDLPDRLRRHLIEPDALLEPGAGGESPARGKAIIVQPSATVGVLRR
jgi:hypothetical protein